MSSGQATNTGIAIVGMAGRFPKARHIDEFWRNLCNGVEGISFFTREELAASGVTVPNDDPNCVRARGILEGADLFDAAFFGFTPREAEVMDPQHRVFLECAWEALEDAACDPARFDGAIGVFAGMSMNTYLAHNVLTHPEIVAQFGESHLIFCNDKDYLTTRVSYKLNLRGPSLNIQTACSTSLVAVCVACQNLLAYECDMALAGGVSISFPQRRAYVYQEGGIPSPDGHCRAFDAKAAGTVAGEGVGIVVLKRLADALADGDAVYAVIKGYAINNDGSQKIGYTAPGVEGQAGVIATAQAMAGFSPETIGYIEAHGTGTPLGDPIEIEGLTQAFAGTTAKHFCAIGAVKSNVGHLDTAAGVTGLIKAVLALHHQKLPPNLHFESPNPKIDFANSPFFLNGALTEWTKGSRPRRAGVSSFGIGGTNAHVVLEESPAIKPSGKSQRPHLLLLSAKTQGALDQATANLAGHLQQHPELAPADVAYTLQKGRREFAYRRMLVCRDVSDAVAGLTSLDETRVFTGVAENDRPPVVFMFPGQGAQQVNMALELYQTEPTFREQIDLCCELLKPHLEFDLRTTLYPEAARIEDAQAQLTRTSITQPALFVVEHALAKLWMKWGVQPEVMIGHSIGEYVAACLAGVFSLEDALTLVIARGRLMQGMPPGAMLAVRLPEEEILMRLHGSLSLSAVNGAAACVVAGPHEAIEELRRDLAQHAVAYTVLRTSHAFHSAMMDPILDPFRELVGTLNLKAPELPFISNVTGALITAHEATDPMYWVRHLRHTVRFAAGLGELLRSPERIFLETGPSQTLSGLAKLHPARNPKTLVCASLPRGGDSSSALEATLTSLGQMWLAGATVNWRNVHHGEPRHSERLPTYPFDRKRHFIEPAYAPHDVRSGSASPFIPALSDVKPDSLSCSANVQLLPVGSSNGQKTGRDAARDGANGGRGAQEPPSNGNGTERDPLARLPARKERIAAGIARLLGELSGLHIASTNGTVTFTEMGFDSLFLTQASLAIEKTFGVRVAFRQLLKEFSSVDTLAAHIDSVLPSEQQEPARIHRDPQGTPLIGTALERANGVVTVPVAESQRELWLASQMSDAASCAYNECRLLHLRGPLKADALRAALQQLVNRHEALRTTFDSTGEFQHIHPALKLDVPAVDLTELNAEARASRWDAIQVAESRGVFHLSNGPLIRAQLIRLGEQEHELMLTIHHIVCDGHSFGILLRELAALYSAETRGVSSGLLTPLQLSDFVNAQTRRRANNGRPDDEAYWVKRFAAGAPMLELPTDRPRPAIRTFDGARASRPLPGALARDLKRVAAQHGCTWFTTLLAGCFGLLHRLSGQRDIVIGIPIADRAMEGGDTLVGHCIHFLPLRATVIEDQSCAEHLGAVREAFLDAHEHQHFTYGSLVQTLNLPRDGDRIPLVSVTFNAARLDGDLTFAGLETDVATNAHSFTNFDLSFDVGEMNGSVQLECRYNRNVFAAETVQRWLGHFQTLLAAIAAEPRQRVWELPLLTAAQREQILVEWNDTRTDYPKDQTVAQLFEEQAARTPGDVAVEFEGARLTYRELNQRANQLAHHLQKRGVGPDVLVAVCLERSLDMIISLLGILKAGGAYLPLDAASPKERLGLMLDEARAPIVLTQDTLRPLLPETDHVLYLDVNEKEVGREPMTQPASKATAGSLAYISFTSGSSGKPKGVCVPHRAVIRLVKNTNYASFAATDVAFQLAPLAFDASTFEIWGALLNGARLVMFPPHAPSLAELGEFIQQRGITTLWLTSGLFHHMIEEQANSLRGVRQLLAGGDVLSVPHVKRALELLPECRLINGYGPTENTTFTCCHPITNASVDQRSIPIGRPIANTQVYLLDQHLQPVPVGVPGELYTGGDGLARGYLNQPELTAENFVADPFANDSSARLYKTGDLARWLPDGNIEFLGRLDAQVKIRGNRVELSEIETVLTRHPAVRECVVVARKDRFGDKQLTAYSVGTNSAPPAVDELRGHLRRALPDYMIPSRFVRLQSLPLTANGKVDRKALPDPGEPESESRRPAVPVSDEVERQLAAIWQEILGHSRVGASDDFFELGGHSLLALRLIARVETMFGKRIPVASVFDSRTVAQMAKLLRQESQPPRATSIVEIQPQGSRPPLMLVHGAGGGMLWGYTALALHLGTDQPVYAFKSRGLDGQEEFGTIEEMAAHYVADLRNFQPQGPYYLGGYCFGGNVAYEMARQLHEQGERVALLALLNSIPPNSAYDRAAPTPMWLARFAGNLCYFTGCLLRRPGPERRLFIGWYARTFARRIARVFARRATSEVIVDELVDLTAYPPEQRQLWRTHIHALFRHRTKPYAGRVMLLRSHGHPFWCSFDDAYGWHAFAGGGAAVHLVPGAHEQILDEPHVSVLAEELRGELARAQHNEPLQFTARFEPARSSLPIAVNKNPRSHPLRRNGARKESSIVQMFEAQVTRSPDAVAVIGEGMSLTYTELNAHANQVGNYLRSLGVKAETLVGICLERSWRMTVAILGVLKAGGAYVPLDPAYPKDRLRFILDDAQPPVILTQRDLSDLLSDVNERAASDGVRRPTTVVLLDSDREKIRKAGGKNPVPKPKAEDLAYLIYTSGSTGKPKGVLICHGSLANHSRAVAGIYQLSPGDRVLQFTSLSFDVAGEEIFPAWISGATVVLRSEACTGSFDLFLRFVEQERITVLNLPASWWHELIDDLESSGAAVPASLRLLVTGNERVLPEALAQWRKLTGNRVRWFNAYGPTEATITATLYEADSSTPLPETHSVPIGQPIANVQALVLDERLRPVPDGEAGELHLGGAGLARGYLNRPDLTGAKFIPNPFDDDPGARLYKTGDRVRRLPDGNLDFIGRIDEQVKIRGFRIEPGEIELALVRHPAVKQAVVVAREDTPGDHRLVAYFVAKPGALIANGEFRSFLKEALPEYMVPAAFVAMAELPLTPNGKVDRKGLPGTDPGTPVLAGEFVAPRDETERQLTTIWEGMLNTRPIGVRHQFFDLGGNSLLAARIVARIEKTFGRKLTTAAIFQSPTIEQLAALLRGGEQKNPRFASSIVEIQSHGSKPPLFLVHGIGGGMLWGYANLARFLGPDQPVYAFNSRGLDSEEFGTLEAMALQYVADLRAFQPWGSYRLGGYCFGGNVAYEMARLLEAQGQTVSFLALFNCPLPNSGYYHVRPTPRFCVNLLRNFSNRLGHVLHLKPEQRRQLVLWRARVIKKHCFNLLNRMRGVTVALDVDDWVDLTTQPEDRRELWATHLRAYADYRPKPYGGHVTLFRTRGHPLVCSFDNACGWGEFASGGVTVHVVPGEHESILDVPHVKLLAKLIEPYLQPDPVTAGGRSDRRAAPPISPEEKHRLLVEWNRTRADYSRESCIHQLFEEQVGRTPDAVAVVFGDQSLTYGELNGRAERLAQHLRGFNVGPDVPVGICIERSFDMVIGVLAILKAGGAYVPLDPAYPSERLQVMVENAGMPVLLTKASLQDRLLFPIATLRIVCVDSLADTAPQEAPQPVAATHPEHLAYVIHTSGSTGGPKGVAMPHRALVNLIAWQLRNSTLKEGGRTLQFASLSFDVSFQEMFSTWCAGGTLVLVNETLRRDPVALWQFIGEMKIERLFLPFVALQQLAEAFKPGTSGDWRLREIITAGEQLQTTPAIVRLFEHLKDCMLCNHYGPSESHVVTACTLNGPPSRWPALPSIGRPIANTEIYLLDEERQPVPVGVAGEIYIGGDCLARGYLHRPDLTACRFFPHPFNEDTRARLYKTGDLARYQPDGNIDFLGRWDEQVKIRGFRVELGEVEATLRQHAKVRDAVVMARADQPGPKRLVAYYISQPAKPCASGELHLFLKDKLPEYMVPAVFVPLEVFPLTPSGKVDRQRMPAPEPSRLELAGGYQPPQTPTQKAVAKIWAEVLGLTHVGIHDNFFHLGGNSLLAVQAIARMGQAFGVELPVAGLFDSPTIALAAEELPQVPCAGETHETNPPPAVLVT
ncbi:MAG: amino acid adenylation domain-containing protein [Verrucomicrobia bacterium]|nr:amino acid adenylation domain-containing protein [Verrucomicrobiota bacterium]